jgi:small conductance mechanosensitive channel
MAEATPKSQPQPQPKMPKMLKSIIKPKPTNVPVIEKQPLIEDPQTFKENLSNFYNSENFVYVRYILAIILVFSTFPISSGITSRLQETNFKNEEIENFFQKGLAVLLIRFFTLIIMLFLAMRVIGLNKLYLASYVGVLLIAIPTAMSSQIANYFSGLLLIAFDRIRLGDYVLLDEFEGKINKLNLFSVELKDQFTRKTRYIPNADFWTKSFVNVSKNTTAKIITEITVASNNDFDMIENDIFDILEDRFEGIDVGQTTVMYEHSTWGTKIRVAVEVPSKKYFEYKILLLKTLRKELSYNEDIEFVK